MVLLPLETYQSGISHKVMVNTIPTHLTLRGQSVQPTVTVTIVPAYLHTDEVRHFHTQSEDINSAC